MRQVFANDHTAGLERLEKPICIIASAPRDERNLAAGEDLNVNRRILNAVLDSVVV
jgi:hypothetical protein